MCRPSRATPSSSSIRGRSPARCASCAGGACPFSRASGEAAPVENGWEDRWRDFHRPIRIGPLWVGPPWEEAPPGAVAVWIDPGRAFGTGAHPTTRLCLELLLDVRRGSLLDVGCGSGVIA